MDWGAVVVEAGLIALARTAAGRVRPPARGEGGRAPPRPAHRRPHRPPLPHAPMSSPLTIGVIGFLLDRMMGKLQSMVTFSDKR